MVVSRGGGESSATNKPYSLSSRTAFAGGEFVSQWGRSLQSLMRVRRRTLARELVALVLQVRTRVNEWEKAPFSARNRTVDGHTFGSFYEDAEYGFVFIYKHPEQTMFFNTRGERVNYW